jgi:hypothetical protein
MRDTRSSKPTKSEIEQRAYQLYLRRGKTEGRALQDWIQAEREVNEDFALGRRLESLSHDHTSFHATPQH